MFCNIQCRTEAMQSFHKYECLAIDMVRELCKDPVETVPLRIITTALALFDGDLKSMYEYSEDTDLQCDDTTVFEVDHTRPLTAYGKFAPIYGMVSATDKRHKPNEAIEWAIIMILRHCKMTNVRKYRPTIRYLRKLIEHFSTTVPPFAMIESGVDVLMKQQKLPASAAKSYNSHGVYPFQFLFNHSCVPNVLAVPYGSQMTMTICRPVKAGEQLFISYGYGIFCSSIAQHIVVR